MCVLPCRMRCLCHPSPPRNASASLRHLRILLGKLQPKRGQLFRLRRCALWIYLKMLPMFDWIYVNQWALHQQQPMFPICRLQLLNGWQFLSCQLFLLQWIFHSLPWLLPKMPSHLLHLLRNCILAHAQSLGNCPVRHTVLIQKLLCA